MFIICMNEEQMFNSISKLVTMGLRLKFKTPIYIQTYFDKIRVCGCNVFAKG